MSQWKPVPIVGGAYMDDTRPFSVQDCINYLPEQADASGTRAPTMLRGLPGLTTIASSLPGWIRGIHNVEGQLFCVAGSQLCRINNDFSVTQLGQVNGVDFVGMEHNQVAGGNQLAIGTGAAGFVWDTSNSTFQQITDPGFPGTPAFVYADSYLAGVEPQGRFWFISELADALSYNTLDQQEAEAAPDLILSLLVNHREIWAMGQRTIEPFGDTGLAPGSGGATWQPIQGVVIEQGVGSKWCSVVLDNAVLFFGNDGIFYRADGYTLTRISTHAIEQAVRGLNWAQCFAYTWPDMGHKGAYWTFPDGHTWGFDEATSLWHRRQSYRLQRSRIACMTYWNGLWIAGDYQTGTLYKLDWSNFTEAGQPFIAERTTGGLSDNQNLMTVSGVVLVMDTGRGAINNDHSVELCYSNDGGYNFTKWRPKSLGGNGKYGKRLRFWKIGSCVNRVFRIRVASPCKRDLIAASIKLDGTES